MNTFDNLRTSVQAGIRFLYVTGQDEFRIQRELTSLAMNRDFECFYWSFGSGMQTLQIDMENKLTINQAKAVMSGPQAPQSNLPIALTPLDAIMYIQQKMAALAKAKEELAKQKPTVAAPAPKAHSYDDARATVVSDSTKRQNAVKLPPSGAMFVLHDYHLALGDASIMSQLKKIINYANNASIDVTVIILTAVRKIPLELENFAKIIELDLLSEEEINVELSKFASDVHNITEKIGAPMDYTSDEIQLLSKAAIGMTEYDLNIMLRELSVVHGSSSKIEVPEVIEYKKQCIARSEGIEYYDSKEGLKAVGGLEALKDWLTARRSAFTPEARRFGLPVPKGMLMLGVPGTGKSLVCKTVAKEWNIPLVRLDIGKMMGSLVGQSEANIRRAIKLAERVSPCVLWLDEIEKGLSGVKSSSVTDGGTIARVFSYFLSWLQDKTAPVFVIATANSVTELPPELLRKGRFDEIFFTDLPNTNERKEIFTIHLNKRGRKPETFDLDYLAANTEGYVGSEIEQGIVSAMFEVFEKYGGKQDIDTVALATAMQEIIPLSKMQEEKITPLRQWAQENARLASKPENASAY